MRSPGSRSRENRGKSVQRPGKKLRSKEWIERIAEISNELVGASSEKLLPFFPPLLPSHIVDRYLLYVTITFLINKTLNQEFGLNFADIAFSCINEIKKKKKTFSDDHSRLRCCFHLGKNNFRDCCEYPRLSRFEDTINPSVIPIVLKIHFSKIIPSRGGCNFVASHSAKPNKMVSSDGDRRNYKMPSNAASW